MLMYGLNEKSSITYYSYFQLFLFFFLALITAGWRCPDKFDRDKVFKDVFS